MSRILITGVDGFTGRYLAPELAAAGHEVHGLMNRDLAAGEAPLPGVHRLHVCNLLDREGLARVVLEARPAKVAHLAAIAFVAHDDVEAIYRTNVIGTRHLLSALADDRLAVTAALLASSANIYGNNTEGVLDESVAPAPANDYAVSKLAMEYLARTWVHRLPITIVRPFNYTGVGQSESFLLPKIVAHFKRRAPVLELGNLDVERDFSDVRTVADCYLRLLGANVAGGVFNVCSGQGHKLQEVLRMATEATGHSPDIVVNPAFVRANEVRRLVGSKRALEAAIGPVSGPDLADTLRWMLSSR
ncbi:MAG: GDP-mannose 4,6-dehydratase [Burkholderiales bacterium]|nr:GDP-mannose 4,6-dehydratase [Burkholderiales bacterium]